MVTGRGILFICSTGVLTRVDIYLLTHQHISQCLLVSSVSHPTLIYSCAQPFFNLDEKLLVLFL